MKSASNLDGFLIKISNLKIKRWGGIKIFYLDLKIQKAEFWTLL